MRRRDAVARIAALVVLWVALLGGFYREDATAQEVGQQVPDGYYLSAEDLALSLPTSIADTSGDHKVLIERRFGSPEEERLLRIAEALYPPRDTLEAAIQRAKFKVGDLPDDGDLWWSSSFDGIRLPFAITGKAVRYYLGLTDSFERGDFEGSKGIRMESSYFRYTATIDRQETFELSGLSLEDVYVVRLRLSWSNYCGLLCALGLEHSRVVVLSPDGEVLRVSGDREAAVFVS